jgi:hypothetical protein
LSTKEFVQKQAAGDRRLDFAPLAMAEGSDCSVRAQSNVHKNLPDRHAFNPPIPNFEPLLLSLEQPAWS